jgi:chromosome segregation ATPase
MHAPDQIVAQLMAADRRLTRERVAAREEVPESQDWRRGPAGHAFLQREMKALSEKCAAQERELIRLRRANERSMIEIQTLRQTNRTIDQRNLEQSQMIHGQELRLNEQDEVIRQLDANARNLVARYRRKKAQFADQRCLVQKLTSDLRVAQVSANEKALLEANGSALRDECESLRSQLHAARRAVSAEEAAHAATLSELGHARSELRDLEEAMADGRRRTEESAAKLRELAGANAKLSAGNRDLREKLDSSVQQLTALEAQARKGCPGQDAMLAAKQELVAVLSADLESYSRENRSLKEFALALQAQASSAHEIIAQYLGPSEESIDELEASDADDSTSQGIKTALQNILRLCGDEELLTNHESPVEDWNADLDTSGVSTEEPEIVVVPDEDHAHWALSGEEEEEKFDR